MITREGGPIFLEDPGQCVDQVIEKVGKDIVLGIPLGAGKPNHFVNAIYQRVKEDLSLQLTIMTALTLEKPKGNSLLEKRFFEPFAERVFGDYPDLLFELDRTAGNLPQNVRVIEFYFPAGKYVRNPQAQKDYTSSNYTHVARDILDAGLNVLAQMISISDDRSRVSLSCNADVTLDIMSSKRGEEIVFVGQVNNQLPYMYGDADVAIDAFDLVLEHPHLEHKIFGPPKMAISEADYMIGFLTSTLIRDDGELQIGIGSLGDALVYALLMRQNENDQYLQVLGDFEIETRFGPSIAKIGDTTPFEKGLFGATEMLVDSFMFLVDSGIMKRKVFDHVILQRLINEGLIQEERIVPDTLFRLLRRGAIHSQLTIEDFAFLQHFGILKEELQFRHGSIYFEDGSFVQADLNIDEASEAIITKGLGEHLKNGAIIHAGFFLGPAKFYEWLHQLPDATKRLIHMKSVRKINQLYGHEEIDRLHRKNARFVNTCMMMTLLGAAVSDQLEDGTVISGVGGQYNFVEMAQALPDGRSILQLRATRTANGKVQSNVVWNYGHVTIPRHLRDIVVTEYGIADIRGKTDEEVVKELLCVADSRFQPELVARAKAAGKLSEDHQIPEAFTHNYSNRIRQKVGRFRKDGLFPVFPFGTDFTHEEQVIGKALKSLKTRTSGFWPRLSTILRALTIMKIPDETVPYLKRMQLDKPRNFQENLYQKLLILVLQKLKGA